MEAVPHVLQDRIGDGEFAVIAGSEEQAREKGAVEIAAAADEQVELSGDIDGSPGIAVAVLWIVGLDAVESLLAQVGGHFEAFAVGQGMAGVGVGPEGESIGGMDGGDAVAGEGYLAVDIAWAAASDQAVESLFGCPAVSAVDECLGDMGSADDEAVAGGDGIFEADGKAEAAEFVDDGEVSLLSPADDAFEEVLEGLAVGVDEKADDVEFVAVGILGSQFDAWDGVELEFAGSAAEFGEAVGGVMVGECDGGDALFFCQFGQFGRCAGAVGGGAVRVQIYHYFFTFFSSDVIVRPSALKLGDLTG